MRRAHHSLLLCFAFIFVVLSQADQPINKFKPHVLKSFNPGLIQQNLEKCTYTVVITTSCLSPKYTNDQISITFGDAFGNQVFEPQLINPFTTTLDRCSTNTFQIVGPCSLQICYVYFYRNGTDGWIPQSVEIFGSFSAPTTFFFNETNVPEDKWYGVNKCHPIPTPPGPPLPPSSAFRQEIIHGWFLCLFLGIIAISMFPFY